MHDTFNDNNLPSWKKKKNKIKKEKKRHDTSNDKLTRSVCNEVKNSLYGKPTRSACYGNDHVNQVEAVTGKLYVQLQDGKGPDLTDKGIEFAHLDVHSVIGVILEFRHLCGSTFDQITVNEAVCNHTISGDDWS